MGTLNPLRYRGYVYDRETGLYYLQSRYYNPEWGRFLNADTFVSTGQGLLGNNMFAYCNNNPVMGCDPCGTCIHNWKFYDCEKCAAFWSGVSEWILDACNTITSVNQQQSLLQTQVTTQQNKMIADAAEATWDAYMWSYNMQQETQQKEAQIMVDVAVQVNNYLGTHEDLAQGLSGTGKVVKGVVGIGSGVGLLIAPIPTPVDDLVGIRKITFGVYNVCYGIAEITGAFVG